MARFDPNTYPDRFAFEAHARRIRAEEAGRVFGAVAAWLRGRAQGMAGGTPRITGVVAAVSHRHSTH